MEDRDEPGRPAYRPRVGGDRAVGSVKRRLRCVCHAVPGPARTIYEDSIFDATRVQRDSIAEAFQTNSQAYNSDVFDVTAVSRSRAIFPSARSSVDGETERAR